MADLELLNENKVLCNYCEKEAKKVTGGEIYKKPKYNRYDLLAKEFFLCETCDAYIGVSDKDSSLPAGLLANKELREAKIKAHNHFDPIWKEGNKNKQKAFVELAKFLGIKYKDCHIKFFTLEMCNKVLEFKIKEP